MTIIKTVAFVSLSFIGVLAPLSAQDGDSIEWDGYVSIASDNRDRGVSLKDVDPAFSANLTVSKGSFFTGIYGAWSKDFEDRNGQAEIFAGYTFPLDGWDLTVLGELDSFHGSEDSAYYPELKTYVSRDYGLAYVSLGASWAMEGRWNAPESDVFYSWLDVDIPIPSMPEFTIVGHVGKDFIEGHKDLTDWSIGISAFVKDFEVTASYVDSTFSGKRGKGKFVASLRYYF